MPSATEPPSLIVRTGVRVAGLQELAGFAATLQRRITRGRAFDCLLTDDTELRRLNRRFRGKNKATDVLSFPGNGHGPLGDIAVSVDHARAQASALGHRVGDEIRVLMLHGVLHLMGMDHESDSGEMSRAEAAWRRRLGLPAGLIERSHA